MIRLPIGTETRLPAQALFRLEDGVSQWIECENGAIWISQQNDPRDIVLTAGESAIVATPRGAIVGAINGAAVVWTDHTQGIAAAA